MVSSCSDPLMAVKTNIRGSPDCYMQSLSWVFRDSLRGTSCWASEITSHNGLVRVKSGRHGQWKWKWMQYAA